MKRLLIVGALLLAAGATTSAEGVHKADTTVPTGHVKFIWAGQNSTCSYADGTLYLDEKLKGLDIDTIVIVGLWTDECVLSTASAGNSRGYDVVVVGDAVATATDNQETALRVANSPVAKVVSTDDLVLYVQNDFVTREPGAVKGTRHPDGRNDDE